MTSQNTSGAKEGQGKKMFLLMAFIFILPFTLAFTLHLLDIRPSGKSFGNLIAPVIELDIPAFNDTAGTTFPAEKWNKIWSIVMVDAASCPEDCEQNVDKLNRVHRTLFKDKDRIQRILILKSGFDLMRIKQLQEKFPALIVLVAKSPAEQQFVRQFDVAAPAGSMYLVDPHGNLMMHYPQSAEPKGLHKDIKKLLKTSWNG